MTRSRSRLVRGVTCRASISCICSIRLRQPSANGWRRRTRRPEGPSKACSKRDRRRHPQRDPESLQQDLASARSEVEALWIVLDDFRRSRCLPVCPRASVRPDGRRALDSGRRRNRCRRAGTARFRSRNGADPGETRGLLIDDGRVILLVEDLAPWDVGAGDLEQALISFERLQGETARRVLGFYHTRAKGPAGVPAAAAC